MQTDSVSRPAPERADLAFTHLHGAPLRSALTVPATEGVSHATLV